MTEMKSYHVDFSIDVVDDSPKHACQQAWHALTMHGIRPTGTVCDEQGNMENVDLEEVREEVVA